MLHPLEVLKGSGVKVRAGVLAVMLAAVLGLAVPSAAFATNDYYFGNESTNYYWPYCATSNCQFEYEGLAFYLFESSARTLNGQTVCAATFDTAVVCSSTLAYKALCGCSVRNGYSRAAYNSFVPYGHARVRY